MNPEDSLVCLPADVIESIGRYLEPHEFALLTCCVSKQLRRTCSVLTVKSIVKVEILDSNIAVASHKCELLGPKRTTKYDITWHVTNKLIKDHFMGGDSYMIDPTNQMCSYLKNCRRITFKAKKTYYYTKVNMLMLIGLNFDIITFENCLEPDDAHIIFPYRTYTNNFAKSWRGPRIITRRETPLSCQIIDQD